MDSLKKSFLIIILIIGVIAMTVAFAAFSTNLRISGTASVPDTDWNIHFQNWTNNTQETANGHTNTAVYPDAGDLTKTLSPNITLVQGLNVTLNQPGDYASYKFQIINEGSIDAELSSFSAPMTCTSGSGCDDVINYEVKCYDNENYTGSELTTHSVLEKTNGLAYCYLKVEYKDKTNQNSGNAGSSQTYSQDPITASLSASWQWIQKTNNGQSGNNSGNEQGNNEPVTPSNPNETTFDGNYTYLWQYSHGWFSELNTQQPAYIRDDGSKKELCIIQSLGVTCMHGSSQGFYDDFGTEPYQIENMTGYVSNKIAELERKGAECYTEEYDDSTRVYCYDENDSIFTIYPNGRVGSEFPDDSGACYIEGNGEYECF